jgi:hypothetical protein
MALKIKTSARCIIYYASGFMWQNDMFYIIDYFSIQTHKKMGHSKRKLGQKVIEY